VNFVFLDTVGLVALWDVADQWHAAAEKAYAHVVSDRRRFATTTFVLLECGNMAARRPYRSRVSNLRDKLERRNELIAPTEGDWKVAWNAYEHDEAGQAGIVDQVSFAVMRRLGITQAFTNDSHFKAAGFETLF
jgi:predicted nucleic acid-binding protein